MQTLLFNILQEPKTVTTILIKIFLEQKCPIIFANNFFQQMKTERVAKKYSFLILIKIILAMAYKITTTKKVESCFKVLDKAFTVF